jgi:hypothetical protein
MFMLIWICEGGPVHKQELMRLLKDGGLVSLGVPG